MKIEKIKEEIEKKEKEIINLKEQLSTIHEYESIIILNTNTALKEYEEIKSKITNIIGKDNISKIEEMGTKKLAYTIQKQNEGYYIIINFEGIKSICHDLEVFYRINDNVLKFITIRKDGEE